ncbi:hypothetical protein L6164_019024 [Bauhinia variegata]|uniref:Uncharacterized protein n=1 Tax=Bauhinia variegata TaxID=167791 RepID=A0ACB9ND50_BAUVA|nr:hypothetical protein L6164_019024 [Bauhinia variegata]
MSKTSESEEHRQLEKIEGSKEERGDGKVEEIIIGVQDDAKECKTPTGSCNQIAATTTCPPAPRKRRPTSLSYYKRKRASFSANDPLSFFEDTRTQEVDSFFQSLSRVNKRCRSI